ncbi:FtsL-like putative cell division protein [Oscillospiraceae bacterium MB08-C2-2]|nr:FtsL-like putative cell division protein [Oscillospiraceae bacterium MB08-C2-2]
MSAANTNLAYDFSAFQSRTLTLPRKRLEVVENKSDNRRASAFFSIKAVASFAIVVTLLSLIIYNQATLHEMTGEINQINQQLTELKSDNVKLTSDLESIVSLRNVETRAHEELGLQRMDKYQTEYINLFGEDKVVLPEGAEQAGTAQKVKDTVNDAINGIKEYIGD